MWAIRALPRTVSSPTMVPPVAQGRRNPACPCAEESVSTPSLTPGAFQSLPTGSTASLAPSPAASGNIGSDKVGSADAGLSTPVRPACSPPKAPGRAPPFRSSGCGGEICRSKARCAPGKAGRLSSWEGASERSGSSTETVAAALADGVDSACIRMIGAGGAHGWGSAATSTGSVDASRIAMSIMHGDSGDDSGSIWSSSPVPGCFPAVSSGSEVPAGESTAHSKPLPSASPAPASSRSVNATAEPCATSPTGPRKTDPAAPPAPASGIDIENSPNVMRLPGQTEISLLLLQPGGYQIFTGRR